MVEEIDGLDEDRGLQISKIYYWTEKLPEDLFDYWARYREKALKHCALNYLNSKA